MHKCGVTLMKSPAFFSTFGFFPAKEAEKNNTVAINVPVVYMAQYVMVLSRASSNEGHWKGWALEIETL